MKNVLKAPHCPQTSIFTGHGDAHPLMTRVASFCMHTGMVAVHNKMFVQGLCTVPVENARGEVWEGERTQDAIWVGNIWAGNWGQVHVADQS